MADDDAPTPMDRRLLEFIGVADPLVTFVPTAALTMPTTSGVSAPPSPRWTGPIC